MATHDSLSPSAASTFEKRDWRSSLATWLGCLLILAPATLFWARRECGGDLNQVPGATRDDVFYDNIAWHLEGGGGFRLGFSAWDWLQPYRRAQNGVDREWIFQTRVDGPTTSRAPIFPLLLSVSYRLFGRRWDAVRIGQIVILVMGLAALLVWAGRQARSRWLPFVGAATLAADFGVLGAAGQIMTEVTATAGMAGLLVAFCAAARRPTAARWLGAGLLMGMVLLTRSTLVGWLVLALPLLAGLCLVRLYFRQPAGQLLRNACLVYVGLGAVCLPWWLRNCRRAEAFEPFGSAGKIGMVGGYCDGCVELGGNWFLPAVQEVEREVRSRPGFFDVDLPRKEHLTGVESEHRAAAWARDNVPKLPWLATMKGLTHLGLWSQPQPWVVVANALLVGGAIGGCWLSRRTFGGWIFLATALSVATTMLTWSHYGRFAIPIRPFWHLAAAVTVVEFWRWVGRKTW